MPTTFLKPAQGQDGAALKVRKPDGSPLAPEGEAVEINSYWLRRLEDGDVAEAKPAKTPKVNQE